MALLGDISHCAYKLAIATGILQTVSHGVDVFDSPVRQEQTIGMLEICRSLRGTIDDFLIGGPILRMDALHHGIYCWLNRAVILENAIGFV